MSKWRPSDQGCIYVIPDIHGRSSELELILKRILPLRFNKNARDYLVFLGDYIDRGPQTPEVLNKLIKLEEKYKGQVFFLRGNHEDMLLRACELLPNDRDDMEISYKTLWAMNGGYQTIDSYIRYKKITDIYDVTKINIDRGISFIDDKHIDFLYNKTKMYHIINNFTFVHAGMNLHVGIEDQTDQTLLWDRKFYEYIRSGFDNGSETFLVCGHNCEGPLISENYLMLDGSYHEKLYIAELNSGEIFYATYGKKKLLKYEKNIYEKQ